ncbi:hypothetical protein BT96DRAFT_988729 [Gymnopus androsaceus JB14]|uniref:Uncharacterized protein n=1 Tax=Gymnopus androsaceus JB14 TaxID=1447944 RepID=A0A6A4I3Y1_9AGAR|nr:hypothetical protein BT96DRAFT_988729 [Gymnopus androsaceus JB14]
MHRLKDKNPPELRHLLVQFQPDFSAQRNCLLQFSFCSIAFTPLCIALKLAFLILSLVTVSVACAIPLHAWSNAQLKTRYNREVKVAVRNHELSVSRDEQRGAIDPAELEEWMNAFFALPDVVTKGQKDKDGSTIVEEEPFYFLSPLAPK